MTDYKDVKDLIGETLTSVTKDGTERIEFKTKSGKHYSMEHVEDCCEEVYLEDVCGDLEDLVGSPIIQADEDTNSDNPPEHADSFTWTFYNIATKKGHVTLRWLGESNGYYSESVDFLLIGDSGSNE